MCGKENQKLVRVRIEQAVLSVCASCARFGKPLPVTARAPQVSGAAKMQRAEKKAERKGERSYGLEEENELAIDYPRRIRDARAALGWKQEELAARVNEKKSVIKDLEAGTLVPDNNVVAKLEKVLKIKLLEKKQQMQAPPQQSRKSMTLGDFVR